MMDDTKKAPDGAEQAADPSPDYLNMSIKEVGTLSPEEQEKAYRIALNREMPDSEYEVFSNEIERIISSFGITSEQLNSVSVKFFRFIADAEQMRLAALRAVIDDKEDTAREIFEKLQPFLSEMAKEQAYKHAAPFSKGIIKEAAKRARAAGIDIPTIKAEDDPLLEQTLLTYIHDDLGKANQIYSLLEPHLIEIRKEISKKKNGSRISTQEIILMAARRARSSGENVPELKAERTEKDEHKKHTDKLQKTLTKSFHSTALDEISKVRTVGIVDKTSNALITINNLQISTPDWQATNFGIGADKILLIATSKFTEINGPHQKNPVQKVTINTADFAEMCGNSVIPQLMQTEEEQTVESTRAKNAMKNFIKKTNKDLLSLLHASLSWKGSDSFGGMNLIGSFHIDKHDIQIEFTSAFSQYLVKAPITRTHPGLFRIDERNANAYAIARQMCLHYAMDSNVMRGTENVLKVSSLLRYTNLPSLEDCKRARAKWEDRVKEPFEKALDAIHRVGIITDWKYCRSGKQDLTDAEAMSITDYSDFCNLSVCYVVAGYDERNARRALIAANHEEKQCKASSPSKRRTKKTKTATVPT